MAYTRFYPFNVGLLHLVQGVNTYDYLDSFENATLMLDVDTITAKAARDISDSDGGFEYAVQKARGWKLQIESTTGLASAGVAGRLFGFNFTLTSAGGADVTTLFKLARISMSKELTEARAVRDSASIASGGQDGWKFPVPVGNKFTIDLEAFVGANTALVEELISSWQAVTAFSLAASGTDAISITGNGTLKSGSFGNSQNESTQAVQLECVGTPVITATDARFLPLLALSNSPFEVFITRPGAVQFGGATSAAYISEASMEAPAGPVIQRGTLTGYGALAIS